MNAVERSRAFSDAQSAGIDLSLLEANLGLSVAERWQQHDAALDFALKLQEARRLPPSWEERAFTVQELRAIAAKRK